MSAAQSDEAILESYLESHKLLIVDLSSSSRAILAKTLVEMGAKIYNVILAASYEVALEEIKNHSPSLIFSDYNLENHNALNLANEQRGSANHKECIFFLVTANSSESSIAEAAEEAVDGYLLKPISRPILKKYLIDAIQRKRQPTAFMEYIWAGKEHLESENYDLAQEAFAKASEESENPSLAFYYLGFTEASRNMLSAAEGYFRKGLISKPNHFRCLTGLFDMLFMERKYTDAYKVGYQIAENFPFNAKRLENMLHVLVYNHQFEQIFDYYERYLELKERNPTLTKCISAVLLVAGKFFSSQKDQERTKLAFTLALATSNRNTSILKEIVVNLVENNWVQEAEFFFEDFKPTPEEQNVFQALSFILSNKISTCSQIIEQGRKLLNENVFDPIIYEVMIRRAKEAGLIPYAETLSFEASKKWPKLKSKFVF